MDTPRPDARRDVIPIGDEQLLVGGRITPGVVRIDATVRRPTGPHSPFVHRLLRFLEELDFDGVPRLLGIDEQGRETLSFIEGFVPPDLDATLSDQQLAECARLVRRFHDATAGSELAGREEVVCHNDLSPCNTIFVRGVPRALIDFDAAAPGARVRDVSYALFLWLNLGTDGPDASEQGRRMRVWCDAYGLEARAGLVAEIEARITEGVDRHARQGLGEAQQWWDAQLRWVREWRDQLQQRVG